MLQVVRDTIHTLACTAAPVLVGGLSMSLNHYADTSHMILYSCNLLVVFAVLTFELNFRSK